MTFRILTEPGSGKRKGPKEQFIPLSTDARTALQRWLDLRPDMPTPAVFFRIPFQPSRSERLNYQSAEKLFKHYANLAGLPLKYGQSFHLLRHTAAQRLANLGVPLQDIMTLLGHADPKTTMVYIRVADANLRRTVQRLNYDEQPQPLPNGEIAPSGVLIRTHSAAVIAGAAP